LPEPSVKPKLKDVVVRLLDEHRVMAIATNRPDGWPQATMTGYVNDVFMLYCFVARDSQKHANILRDPRVSIAIGSDAPHPTEIRGLSLAGRAAVVADPGEFDHVSRLRVGRFPEYAGLPPPVLRQGAVQRIAPQPPSAGVVLLRIVPEIISVLDYSKGFGHSDLITFSDRDLDVHIGARSDRWAMP
jgi:hypothetical protein